jgi:hypothetical protein
MPHPETPGIIKQELHDLSHGLSTSPPGGATSLIVGGKSALVADLVTELDGYVAAYQAVEKAEEEYRVALAARTKIETQARDRRKLIRAAIKGAMGGDNQTLGRYGMSPDKPHQALTVEERTHQVAQAKATRIARHTMGKKQKLAIKGELPPAPLATPATPATPTTSTTAKQEG